MHSASVPQKHESSLQMPEKIPQKGQNLGMPDILQGMKADIQSNPPFSRRDADRGDNGYLRPSPGDFKNRGLSDQCPGLFDGRDKAEPALIEEDQGNFKPFGLFLYAATDSVSNVLFPFHPSLWPLSQASDSSSPFRLAATRYYWGDRRSETSSRSPGRFFGSSKDPLSIRSSWLLRRGSEQDFSSGARLASRVVQEPILISTPRHLSSYEDRSNNKPNTTNNRLSWLSPADLSRYPVALRPAAFALQAVPGFHGVAWNQFIIFLLLLRNSITIPRKGLGTWFNASEIFAFTESGISSFVRSFVYSA